MFPIENPFPKTDALIRELEVLGEAFEIAMDLPRALKSAYGCSSLFGQSDGDRSIEQRLSCASPGALEKLRHLRNWVQEVGDPQGTSVSAHPNLTNMYENMARFREGYEFVVFFHDLLRTENKTFPEWYQRRTEQFALNFRE